MPAALGFYLKRGDPITHLVSSASALFVVVLLPLGALAFRFAVRKARQEGSLVQYRSAPRGRCRSGRVMIARFLLFGAMMVPGRCSHGIRDDPLLRHLKVPAPRRQCGGEAEGGSRD